MSLPPYRTTPALVEGIIDVQAGVDVTPFIAIANQLTTDLCTYLPPSPVPPYSDGFVGSKMELIERWLAAHFYTIFDNQLSRAKAGTVSVGYQFKTALNLQASMYGQQVMLLDTGGNLAKQSNIINVERQIKVGGFWAGKRRCWPGDVGDGTEITVEQ